MTLQLHTPAARRRGSRGIDVWPLRTERDYDRARRAVEKLILKKRLSREESSRLDIFLTLMEAYEEEHHRIDASGLDAIDVLKSILQDHEMSASDLGRLLGNRALGSLILNRKRELSKAHIRALSERFRVSAALFL